MTQIDTTNFFYKVEYKKYGYSNRILTSVYERRKRKFWFGEGYYLISGENLTGSRYGQEDPLEVARIEVKTYLRDKAQAEYLVLDTYLPVD